MNVSHRDSRKGQRWAVYGLILVLLALHQDVWWWDDESMVGSFMPVGMAYHVLYSMLAAAAWGLAIVFAWPHELERLADAPTPEPPEVAETLKDSSSGNGDSSGGSGSAS